MKKQFKKIFAMLIAGVMLMVSCSSNNTSNDTSEVDAQKNLQIITSMYPMYDFAKKVAGDKADVENIIPVGTDAHGWEPSAMDITKLEHADLFIYNGAGMEGWVDSVVGSLSNQNLMVVEASEGAKLIKTEKHEEDAHDHDEHSHDGHHHDEHHHDEHDNEEDHHEDHAHHHGEYDPHVWLSIKNAKVQMENIKNALVALDPDNEEYYEENYAKYSEELDELDMLYADTLRDYEGAHIVVAHEAFAYLGADYGISQMGIEGIYEDSEPDPARMKEIIDYVREHDIKVIFFEPLESSEVADAIARETDTKTDILNPIEALSHEDIEAGEDYISIMKKNLVALENALK